MLAIYRGRFSRAYLIRGAGPWRLAEAATVLELGHRGG